MLTGVTLASCAVDAQDRYLAALSGVAFLETKTGLQVIAASAGENALTRFGYDGALTELDTFRLSAHVGLHDLVATQTGLTALARWGNAVRIDANSFTADGQANLVALSDTASAVRNTAGLTLDTLTIADDATAPLGDVTALASLSDGRVIAGSGFDTGIALLNASGTVPDVALAEDGFWHNRVSTIETATIGGKDFAIVGASGSSSLSVFQVLEDELILTDHEWDNMMTRFSGVAELATAQIGGMTVVAAGGSDAGLSLFELTESGDLVHLHDILDTDQATLADISGLDLIAQDDGLLLVASSEKESGFTVFELEFEFEEPAPLFLDPQVQTIHFEQTPRLSNHQPSPEPQEPEATESWIDLHLIEDLLIF